MPRLRLPRLGRRPPPPLMGARIIVGLGNPGVEYGEHRHNVGARAVQRLSELLDLPLSDRGKLTLLGGGETPYGPLVLARPRTFMNESGRAVHSLLTRYRARPEDLLVIVDELDLEPGRVRVRPGGGHGGQKGMRSIEQHVGSLDFPRVRIGVGRPTVGGTPSHDPDVVADHLLSNAGVEEADLLEAAERRAAEAVIVILRDGVEAAMNQFNAESPPPFPPTEGPASRVR